MKNISFLQNQLQQNGQYFLPYLQGVSVEQSRWKPSPEKWSLLEVVNHLYDEEREDFRQRLSILLESAEKEWPSIAPEKWVLERHYQQRDFKESLEKFIEERKQSIQWLKSLSAVNWDVKNIHPKGSLSAGDLLAAWVAHDLLHLRQMVRLQVQYVASMASPYSIQYATAVPLENL